MASVHQHTKSPYWYCSYRRANGQQVFRSTKHRDKEKAQAICQLWQITENQGGDSSALQRRPRPPPRFPLALKKLGAVVYLLKSGDYIKVGKSSKLKKRLAAYSITNPNHTLIGIRVFMYLKQAEDFEKEMHKRFPEQRNGASKRAEWRYDCLGIRQAFVKSTQGQLVYLNLLCSH
jgi:hypothetical protein